MAEEPTLDERIRRGAVLLDENAPPGWRDRVREAGNRFQMRDAGSCVAALAFGETFFKAMRILGLDPFYRPPAGMDDPVYLAGFDVSFAEMDRVEDGGSDEERLYDEFRDAWLRYLDTCTSEDEEVRDDGE
jgi:hypothetical protein